MNLHLGIRVGRKEMHVDNVSPYHDTGVDSSCESTDCIPAGKSRRR